VGPSHRDWRARNFRWLPFAGPEPVLDGRCDREGGGHRHKGLRAGCLDSLGRRLLLHCGKPTQTKETPMTTSATAWLNVWVPRAQGLLRIVVAFLFLQHGAAKLFHVPHVAMFDNLQVMSLFGVAGILEVVGSVLLLIGLFTRPTAFILSGEMAIAYFMAHAVHGNVLVPMLNQGESAVLFCFIFLFFAAAGAGAWSIDTARAAPRA
jgi:putative oxidoreductase